MAESTHETDKHVNKGDFHNTKVPYEYREYPLMLHGEPAIKVVTDEKTLNVAILQGYWPSDESTSFPRRMHKEVTTIVRSDAERDQKLAQGWSLEPVPVPLWEPADAEPGKRKHKHDH